MSEAEKQKSHSRIVDAASRLLRERGIEGTSVSDVMQEAGLTHGGFYRHFKSKEALVSAAFRQAIDEVLSEVEVSPAGSARTKERDLFIARYLSPHHAQNRGHGCPIAAMGAEIAGLDGAARAEASDAFERMAKLLNADDQGATDRGLATVALLMGSITLARLAKTQELATSVLDAGKRGADLLMENL